MANRYTLSTACKSMLSKKNENNNHNRTSATFFRWLLCLLIATGLSMHGSFAQVNYSLSKLTGQTYTTLSGGGITTINTNAGLTAGFGDVTQNDGGVLVTLPFTFNYNGSSFTQMTMSANGWIGCGNQTAITTAQSIASASFFTTTVPNTVIAPWWKDMGANFPIGAGSLRHGSVGTDIYAFQWDKAVGSGTADGSFIWVSFMVKIYGPASTNPGRIEFIYGPKTGAIAFAASIGLEDATGGTNHYINAMSNLGFFSQNGGAINGTTTSAAWPGNGNGYRFDPVSTTCPGTPANQPTALSLTSITGTQVNGSFTAAASNPNAYLVVRYVSGASVTAPVNGTSYAVGGALGSGIVVVSGAAKSFSATGLTANTAYDFYVYSFCADVPTYLTTSPLTASITTSINAVPICAPVYDPANGETDVRVNQVLAWSGSIGSPAVNGYDVYFSTNLSLVTSQDVLARVAVNQAGTTFTPANAFPNVALGPNQTYYWEVIPRNTFGSVTPCVINSFTTHAATSFTSTAIGGLWSSPATWVGGLVPQQGDDVVIADGAIVTVDAVLTIRNLTIGGGASGILQWNATANAINILGDVLINPGAMFLPYTTAQVGVSVNVGGNFTNNGTANLALGTTLLNFNGSQVGGSMAQTLGGTGIFVADQSGRGLIRALFFQTLGSSTISTSQNLVAWSFAHTAGSLNTNGKLAIDNTAQVYGLALNTQVASIAVTGMGAGYTSAPGVAISAPTGGGTTATATPNFDATTGTVRSITITNPGSGYNTAPTITLSGGGFTTAATASLVFIQQVAGPANSLTQKTPQATISGGISIKSDQTVGGISTTNGGVGYSAAPSVGFSLPTGFRNLITTQGAGYTSTPTVTVSGGAQLTGGTAPTFTVIVASGKVVSVICTGGGTLWTALPTLTLTGGGFTTQATCAFPSGCLATATAILTSGQVTNFTITAAGADYVSAPTVGLVTNGSVTTAATTPACRIGLYNLTLGTFTPSNIFTPGTYAEGAEVPSNRRINVYTLGAASNNPVFTNTYSSNLELYSSAPLVLNNGTMDMGSNTLTCSHPSYAGQSGSLTASVKGTITLTTPGGSLTRTFPFEVGLPVIMGTGSLTTGSTITTVTAQITGAPSGTASSVPIGTRSFHVLSNGGSYGTNPQVTLNWNSNDALNSDQAGLLIEQATAVTGPWTARSLSSGTAGAGLALTGTRTTATSSPGPIAPTGDDFYAWATTFSYTPLAYNITRTTGIAYNSIVSNGTGSTLTWNQACCAGDEVTSSAVTISNSTFTYAGQTVTGFQMNLNGWAKLVTSASAATAAVNSYNGVTLSSINPPSLYSNSGSTQLTLAPFWSDLTTAGSSSNYNNFMRYSISPDAIGQRKITMEWYNMTVFANAGPQLNFQCVLDETDNSVTFNYGLFQAYNGTANIGYMTTIGINGMLANLNALPGQVLAQQYENSDVFGNGFCNVLGGDLTGGNGANRMAIAPDCNSSIKFTPGGGYTGGTIPSTAAPSNDDPAGALTVAALPGFPSNLCGNFYSSRYATTTTSIPACAGVNDDDVWFKFTATLANTTVRVYGSGVYVPRLQVLDASFNPIACVVGTSGSQVNATLTTLVPGNLYYVRVYHDGGGVQAQATAIVNNGAVTGLVLTNPGSGYSSGGSGVTTPRIRFSGGGGTDALAAAVMAGTSPNQSVSGFTLSSGGYGYTSVPTITIEKPNWSNTGEFALVVFAVAPNDECATAINLTGLATPGCNASANAYFGQNTLSTTASAEGTVCGVPDDDVWYKFDAVNANTSIGIQGYNGYDPAIQIYDGGVSPGSCGAKTSVQCLNATGAGGAEGIILATTVGNTYFIRVYHAATGAGAPGDVYDICVSSAPPACVTAPSPANGGTSCTIGTTLSWTASIGATGYDVYLDAGSGPATTLVSSNQAGTSYNAGSLAVGTYSWRVEPRNIYGVNSACANLSFTVNPSPTISVSPGSATYCTGGSAGLVASGANTYSWAPAAGLNTTTGASVTASPTVSTTYTVTGTTTSTGCTGTSTVLITVQPPPSIGSITATPSSVCSGGNSQLNVTVLNTVSYSGSFISSVQPTTAQCNDWANFCSSLVAANYQTVKLYGTFDMTGRTVLNPANAQAIAAALKNGTTLTLVDNGNTWVVGNTCGSGNGACQGTLPMELTADGSNCACTTPGYSIRPAIGYINWGGVNTATCAGPNQTIYVDFTLPGGSATYSWLPTTGLSDPSIANPVASPTVTTTYTVTVTVGGCSSTSTVTVTVDPLAVSPTATTAGPSAYCTPVYTSWDGTDYISNVALNGTPAISNPSGAPSSAATSYTNYLNISSTLTAGNQYTITITSGSYSADSYSAWIDYNQNGVFEGSEQLGAAVSPGSFTAFSYNNFMVPAAAINGNTRLRVVCIDGGLTALACPTSSYGETEDYTINITGGANPGPPCGGTPFALAANASGGGQPYTFTWAPATGLNSTTIANPTASPLSTTTYTLTVTDNCGGSATGSVTVTVTTAPTVTVTPSSASYCISGSVPLTASGATTYTWSPAAGLNSTTGANVTASPGITTTYTVTGTANGCSTPATAAISVLSPPNISSVTASPSAVCPGGASSTLTANVSVASLPANSYTLTSLTGQTYSALSGGGVTIINTNAQLLTGFSTGNSDDGGVLVALPFTFNYMGNSFTQMAFSTNGWISPGSSMTTITAGPDRTAGNLFITALPNNTIAAWFKDMGANFPTGTGSMRHGLIGTDVYAFQWDNAVGSGFSDGSTILISFQINIYGPASTNPGRIEYIYGPTVGAIAFAASIGIEDATGGTNHYINALTGDGTSTTVSTAWPGNGNGYRFNPIPPTGLTYTWSVASGPGGLSSTSGNPTTGTNITAATQYAVSVSNGFCSASSSATVTVVDTTFSGLNPDYCEGDGAALLSPVTPGGTFTGTGIVTFQGAYYFDPAVSGIGTFTVTYTLPIGCGSSQTITVHPIPTVTLDPFAPTCSNTPPFILTGGSPAGGTYFDQFGYVTNGNTFDPGAAGAGSHSIFYSYADQFGCSAFAQEDITVNDPTITVYADNDNDGYGAGDPMLVCVQPAGTSLNNTDCNDNDPTVHAPQQYYVDADNDGYGSTATAMLCSSTPPAGFSTNNTDCNDGNASIHPGAPEQCNGIDDNCNGQVDETLNFITFYADADADGYGNPAVFVVSCLQPNGFVEDNTDCNDNDATVHAPQQYYVDADQDGYGSTATAMLCSSTAPTGYSTDNSDCNDNDATVHTPQQYYVDTDEDGYGTIATAIVCSSTAPTGYSTNNTDCNDNDATVHTPQQYYVDADQDGYGSTTTAMLCSSTAPTGYSTDNTDCNDNDATVHTPQQYYADADQDGYGSTTTAMFCSSTAPTGYSTNNTDCNDNDASVHAPQQYYVDADYDGYGSITTAMLCSSTAPTGYSTNNTDCNDNDATVHTPQQYYVDADQDGYGSTTTAMLCSSTAPTGYSTNNTDCNDNNAAVNPGATDICNGVDDNCDGTLDENPLVATITPSGTVTYCRSVPVTLTANSGPGISYLWYKGVTLQAGETNSTFTTTKRGSFRVVESTSACYSNSAYTTVARLAIPQASITVYGSTDICSTGSVLLRANNAGSNNNSHTYQWRKGGLPIIGATDRPYTATSTGDYTVTVTNDNGCSTTSSTVTVTSSCKGSEGTLFNAEMNLYPNPTNGHFVVEIRFADDVNTEADIQIMNALGQNIYLDRTAVVNGELFDEVKFDGNVPGGNYFVRVIVGDKVYTGKIVYQK